MTGHVGTYVWMDVSDLELQGEIEPHTAERVSVWASKFSAEPVSFQLVIFVVFVSIS